MRSEKAKELFAKKFHCSQSVLAVFAEDFGLTLEQALKLGAAFGTGMCKGEVCGACTGALMVIGLKYGQYIEGDVESKQTTNKKTIEFLEKFAKTNGSYLCNDLLKCDIKTPEGIEYARNNNLFIDFCPKMVESAVKILEEVME